MPVPETFDQRYPNLAAWTRDGWFEIGYNDFSDSFIRVIDLGGLVWESEEAYKTVDAALAAAEAAVVRWYDENGRP
jgi:hypothetical protein